MSDPFSPEARQKLSHYLKAIPPSQFEELVFVLNPPPGEISGSQAAQGIRAAELLKWAESPAGCGLRSVYDCLATYIPNLAAKIPLTTPVAPAAAIADNTPAAVAPTAKTRTIRIFLAHASEDKAAVMALYDRLKQQGYKPWLDKKDLLPGQSWRAEIPKAIRESDIFIACLSKLSVEKHGYIQREFRMALNECADKPPGAIYLIPLRLDDC